MKRLIALTVTAAFFFAGCGMKKYIEIVNYQKDVIVSVTEYTTEVAATKDSKAIAESTNKFVERIKPILVRGVELKKKYPDLDKDMPQELQELKKQFETTNSLYTETIKSIEATNKDQNVKDALAKLKEIKITL